MGSDTAIFFANLFLYFLEQLDEENKKTDIRRARRYILDLDIKIRDDRYSIILYDKRNDFPFFIARTPYLYRSILSKIFYSKFGAEMLRIARTFFICIFTHFKSKNIITKYVNINVPGIQVKK